MVIDTHTHAWAAPTPDRPWTNGPLVETAAEFAVPMVYDTDALLADMDRVGIDHAVVVGYPIVHWEDNRYTIEVAADIDRLSAIVMLDPTRPDAAARLRAAMAVEDVVGVRFGAACPPDRMWERFDPATEWLLDAIDQPAFWGAVRETDAAIQVLAHDAQLEQVLALVEAHPDLTYLLDHYSMTDTTVPPDEGPFAAYEELASYDTVYPKLSETPHRSTEAFPYLDMTDHVTYLFEHFGRERLMWGSDFPNVSDVASYEESFTWLEHVPQLSDPDREWLTERTARQVLLE